MVAFPDNAEILHLETRRAQIFDCFFRRAMIREDGNDCVSPIHLILSWVEAAPGHNL
jgi:hypothetical protein